MELRKIFIIAIIGLLGILVQGTLLRTIFPVGYLPNFLVAVLVFLALAEVSVGGVLLAGFLGLLLDLFSSQFIGPWIGSFIIVYAVFALFSTRIYIGSMLIFSLAVAVAALLSSLVYLFMVLPYMEVYQSALLIALYESVLSGLVAPFVYLILKRVFPGSQNQHLLFRQAL